MWGALHWACEVRRWVTPFMHLLCCHLFHEEHTCTAALLGPVTLLSPPHFHTFIPSSSHSSLPFTSFLSSPHPLTPLSPSSSHSSPLSPHYPTPLSPLFSCYSVPYSSCHPLILLFPSSSLLFSVPLILPLLSPRLLFCLSLNPLLSPSLHDTQPTISIYSKSVSLSHILMYPEHPRTFTHIPYPQCIPKPCLVRPTPSQPCISLAEHSMIYLQSIEPYDH